MLLMVKNVTCSPLCHDVNKQVNTNYYQTIQDVYKHYTARNESNLKMYHSISSHHNMKATQQAYLLMLPPVGINKALYLVSSSTH